MSECIYVTSKVESYNLLISGSSSSFFACCSAGQKHCKCCTAFREFISLGSTVVCVGPTSMKQDIITRGQYKLIFFSSTSTSNLKGSLTQDESRARVKETSYLAPLQKSSQVCDFWHQVI